MIRAVAATGLYSDEAASRLLADVLIQRRDRIANVYLNAVNPVVNPALDERGTLTFDNATGETRPIGGPTATTTRSTAAPAPLPSAAGAFVRVQISSATKDNPSWAVPVEAYFRRTATGWQLVGIERLPATTAKTN